MTRLVGTPAWDALEEHLNELRVKLISQVISGYGHDHDDYLLKCGEIKGLDAVLTAPRTPAPKRPATSTR